MVKSRLAADDVQQRGWLLDGYPRSASQAEAIEAQGIRPDCFLLIDVSVSTSILHMARGLGSC
jgi:adenylate kinase